MNNNTAAPISSIYTQSTITRYYVVETQWQCQCGNIIPGPVLNGVRVEVTSPQGNKSTMSLERLLDLYRAIFPHRDPWELIPSMPVEHTIATVKAQQCSHCIPVELGVVGNNNFMPVDLLSRAGSIESPNADFDLIARANAKARNKGKKAKTKAQRKKAQREEQLTIEQQKQLNAIKQGGLAGLNALANL